MPPVYPSCLPLCKHALLPVLLAFGLWLVSTSIRAFRNGTLITAYISLVLAEIMTPIWIMQSTPLAHILPLWWQDAITLSLFPIGIITIARGFWVLWHEQKREREKREREKREREEKSASRSAERLRR